MSFLSLQTTFMLILKLNIAIAWHCLIVKKIKQMKKAKEKSMYTYSYSELFI